MALPNDQVLSDAKFSGTWRPSHEAIALWHRFGYEWVTPPGSNVRLNAKILKHPSASADAVLLMPGFNEPMAKYVQTAFELYTSAAKVSVVLYDHRGQGLSDRSPNLPPTASQNGHFDDFDRECVADCVAMAKHASQVLGLSPGLADGKKEQEKKRLLHVVAHSMGGLIAVHAIANSPDLFTGRVVLSCPMLETFWGDVPALAMPRAVSAKMGVLGTWFGKQHCLAPAPGARLSWWNPCEPIKGVKLTHDQSKLTWFWALRSLNPRMALMGPSMGWIREMTGAQAKTAERVTNAVLKKAKENTGHGASGGGDSGDRGGGLMLAFPPTLLLTAEHDTMVQECGQALFLDDLTAAAATAATATATTKANSSATTAKEGNEEATSSSSCVCAVRVKVMGSYHEPLFEEERISKAVMEAVVGWLTAAAGRDDCTLPSSPASTSSSSSSFLSAADPPAVKVWAARHIAGSNVLKMVQTAPEAISDEGAEATSSSSASSVTSHDNKKAMVLLGLGVAALVGATIALGRRRALKR